MQTGTPHAHRIIYKIKNVENILNYFQKTLDKKERIGYNMSCHCVKSVFQA